MTSGQPDAPSGRPAPSVAAVADAAAAAALAVPGVVRLHAGGGVLGEVATYLPGRRVTGIRLGGAVVAEPATTTEVHVVVRQGVPVRATAERVHAAVEQVVGAPVHVFVEDVDLPDRTDPRQVPPPAARPPSA